MVSPELKLGDHVKKRQKKGEDSMKKAKWKQALWLGWVIFLPACQIQVDLTLKNPAQAKQTVEIQIRNSKGAQKKQPIKVGDIDTNASTSRTFKVPKNGEFEVISTVESAVVFDKTITATPGNNPLTETIELQPSLPYLDDKKAVETIQSKFEKLGRDRGFTCESLQNGLKTWFGALAVVLPPEKDGEVSTVMPLLSPKSFSSEISLDDFRSPQNSDSQTSSVNLSGSATAQLSTPVVGVSFGWETNKVYQLSWKLENYGPVTKEEKLEWNLAKPLSKLSEEESQLLSSYASMKDAKFIYINRIYVVGHASLNRKTGQQVSGRASVVNGVFTASGLYSFDKSETDDKSFSQSILNIDGIEVPSSLISWAINENKTKRPPKVEKAKDIMPFLESAQVEGEAKDKFLFAINPDSNKEDL